MDSFLQGLEVLFQILDTAGVVDLSVLDGVLGAEAVLDREERHLIPAPEIVQGIAEAHGVDLPAEAARLEVGVGIPTSPPVSPKNCWPRSWSWRGSS